MITKSSFLPAWWAKNPHVQTCFASLCRRPATPSYRPERLELADGDFLDLVWVGQGVGPIIAVFHGLGGSMHSPYASGMLHALNKQGYRAVLMHFRGCSGEMNRVTRSYHAGETADMKLVLAALRERVGYETPIYGLGYSLGGNALLKYLGESGKDCLLDAAIAVSVPMQLALCAKRLKEGTSRIYQWHLLRALKKNLIIKMRKVQMGAVLGLTEDEVALVKDLPTFDDRVTAPLHGFRGAEHYYETCSSRQFLKSIAKPTLILHSTDDPFMFPEVVPKEHELGESVTLELSSTGGHVGFVSGTVPWKPVYWLEGRITEYFDTLKGNQAAAKKRVA
ncbi:MAG: hydrolase [Deltaproteobacteria bacterium]|nr:hydrolase [Deltaproteobacteria bacterium]